MTLAMRYAHSFGIGDNRPDDPAILFTRPLEVMFYASGPEVSALDSGGGLIVSGTSDSPRDN